MTSVPFTAAELAALKALAELHKDSDPRAMETYRLVRMVEARDTVIAAMNASYAALVEIMTKDRS